jgi:hypothetical protein
VDGPLVLHLAGGRTIELRVATGALDLSGGSLTLLLSG